MTRIWRTAIVVIIGAMLPAFCGVGAYAADHLVVTNDNNPTANSVSIYKLTGDSLTREGTVPTGGLGIARFYASEVSQSVARDGSDTCVFAGDAGSGDIAAMKVTKSTPFLTVAGNFGSPDGDSGSTAGIGIAISGNYLYANYTTTQSIGVWQIATGCTLTFVTDLTGTGGLNGGSINDMAATPNGKYLVVTYGDGSVGSYAIGGGTISLIGQEIISGYNVGGGADATSVAISSNGQWAIFGDLSATNTTQLDVAGIGSNGALATTISYGGNGLLGNGLNSNGIQLSPNNQFIYVVDSGSGQETTVSFNATTGVISYPNGCLTALAGYNSEWAEASQVADVTTTATGGGIYISEGGFGLSAYSYIALLRVNASGCATEVPGSPFPERFSPALQSISSYSF